MKTYIVRLARVEHRIYEIEVEAANAADAEEMAQDIWDDDDEAFTDMGCVHAEDFIHETIPVKVAA